MPVSKSSSYFDLFPEFTPNPHALLEKELKRLAKQQHWRVGSKKYKKERSKCLLSEFDFHIASMVADDRLNSWQALCAEVGISRPPISITRCKKVLSNVFVNLVDLINSRRTGTKVSTFHNLHALRAYTIEKGKVFPKEQAKQDIVMKVLLREIF